MFGGADESVLRLFTGVRGVKVAKVVGVGVELKEWLERKMMEDVVEEDEDKRCRCREGERKLVCENCGIYVKDDGLGEGDIKEWFAGETRDAWTFGNR